MSTQIPELFLGHYSFTFEAIDLVNLPALSDPLRRSVFGLALHQQSCITPDTDCPTCMLRHQCDFSFFIKGSRPPQSEMMRKIPTIPLPHIFHSDQNGEALIQPGELFSHGLIVVGSACKRLPVVIEAMKKSGQLGFGSKRQQAKLVQVCQHLPGEQQYLLMDQQGIVQESMAHEPVIPPAPKAVRMQFLTPYIPSDKTFSPNSLQMERLLMTVVRRVSLLQYFYMGQPLEADFRQLKELAIQTKITQVNLQRQKETCWSARQQRQVNFLGFRGTLDFSLENIEVFWPFLYLGQWLHLGKQSSKGFGRYQLLAR
ncbi:MAG: CRISPR system precrRNA processing endoribonuclease RAMP protein Cas6 [Candidatus Electrothrix sp. AR3]|nr:CRISPR system precrRNA processing endoribonuclease RAMP protein Cas6 [Candidatus Electrothrix sp. AR3]